MKETWNYLVEWADAIIIFGGVITLFGTILVSIKSNRESDKNATKQQELLDQSLKLNGIMTGGDSYPLLTFSDINHDLGMTYYLVANDSEFPLYLNQMIIADTLGILEMEKHPNFQAIKSHFGGIPKDLLDDHMRYIPMEEIMPGRVAMMGEFPFKFREGAGFGITFGARNGNFFQKSLVHKFNGVWQIATRVTTFEKEPKVLFEHIPENFPPELLKW